MNNWNESEIAFRCDRLSVRLEKLAENFRQMSDLSASRSNLNDLLRLLEESKSFLELTAIDLDFESAYDLAQMQRQLSRWQLHWAAAATDDGLAEISAIARAWVDRVRAIAGVLV